MVKHKIACAVAALATIGGAGILAPGLSHSVFAYEMDDDFAVPMGETDEDRYNDLKTAIQDGKNVKLNSDISYFVQIPGVPSIGIDHTMVLDLNGHVLDTASTSGSTGGNTSIAVTGDGTVLTVLDTSEGASGVIKYSHIGNASPELIRVEAGAKLVLDGGTLVSPQGRTNTREGFAVKLASTGAFEMNGGKISSPAEYPTGYYGVAALAAGSVKITGGEINTNGTAVWLKSGASTIDVSGNSVIKSEQGDVIDISSTTAGGRLVDVKVRKATVAGTVSLERVTIEDALALKGGERSIDGLTVGGNLTISGGTNNLMNITVGGLTTVSAGETTFGNGNKLNGGILYQSGYTAVLTIEDGTTVNGFEQSGKDTSVSYTDKDTKVKFVSNYSTYGALVINGGTFNGNFATPSTEVVETANATRKEYVDSYNEHSGKTAMNYTDVAILPIINGGVFAVEPNEDEITSGYEAEQDEETGAWTIQPKEIKYGPEGKSYIEDGGGEEGHMSVAVEFRKEMVADRKAVLSATGFSVDGLALDENVGGELVSAVDINMLDRDGNKIEVKDNELLVYINLDEETYAKLAKYDKLYAVYFENGAEVERSEIELSNSEDGYYLRFSTPHLSAYGVVGVNEAEATGETSAPETGTVTAAGASATVASIVAAVAVGLLTSAVSFAYLMRRR